MKGIDEVKENLRLHLAELETEAARVNLALRALNGEIDNGYLSPALVKKDSDYMIPVIEMDIDEHAGKKDKAARKAAYYQKQKLIPGSYANSAKPQKAVKLTASERENTIYQILKVMQDLDKPLTGREIEAQIFDQFNNTLELTRLNHLLIRLTEEGKISYKRKGTQYVYWVPKSLPPFVH